MRPWYQEWIYTKIKLFQGFAVFISALLGYWIKVPPDKTGPFAPFTTRFYPHVWIVILLLQLAIAAAQLYGMHIGNPRTWNGIQGVVNQFWRYVFEEKPGPMHHRRVTLFRKVTFVPSFEPIHDWFKPPARKRWPGKFRHPWSGWLRPVVRSGHTTQKSKSFFLAPDDAQHAEGVVGTTWAYSGIVVVDDLPILQNVENDTEDKLRDRITDYANKTWMSPEWVAERVKAGRACATSYCGINVEVNGKRWGVLMIDSAETLRSSTEIKKYYELVGSMLGNLAAGI